MPGSIDNSSDLALFEGYSQGRASAGESLPGLSRFAQWSAVLDKRTCDWCGWADERVFDTTINPYDPPTHHGCRCLIAYISKNEFPPTADWGSGPPKSSWPPGTYVCSKGRLLKLAEATGKCITADLGMNPKPRTDKEVFIKPDEAGFSRTATRSEAAKIQDAADGLAGVDRYSDISGAVKTTVDPSDLIASQDAISANKVDDIIKSGQQYLETSDVVGDGIMAIRDGNQLFLVDGHHRVAAAYREGIDIEIWIIDIDKLF